MNDKTFFAKVRQERTVVPTKVRKFAKFLAIAGMVIFACLLVTTVIMFFVVVSEGHPDMDHIDMDHINIDHIIGPAGVGLGIAVVSLFFAGYIMLLGYVYGDARRRGMPAALWTLLVVLIPNLIGFIVYFILRRGVFAPCSQCGRGAEIGQIYCSSCGHKLDLATASPQPGV